MVYEEEDFQPMQYGYHLNPDISEQRMIGMLREIEEDLHRKTRSKPNHGTHALHARIKFLRVFLQVLISFRKEDQLPTLPDCQRILTTCSEMLYIIKDTVCLGVRNDDRKYEEMKLPKFYNSHGWFSNKLLYDLYDPHIAINTKHLC